MNFRRHGIYPFQWWNMKRLQALYLEIAFVFSLENLSLIIVLSVYICHGKTKYRLQKL